MCLRICRRNHPGLSQLRPYRYAHRGLYDLAKGVPENTLPAFRRAVDHGFGAELDVHLTADGRLVVIPVTTAISPGSAGSLAGLTP